MATPAAMKALLEMESLEREREIYFKIPIFLCGDTPATSG